MGLENGQMKQYLLELYEQSQGESQGESSMYEIGAALGLERSEAGALAEDLIIEGYAELKNLAGGITITAEGIQALEIPGTSDGAGSLPGGLQLGDEPVLSQTSTDAVEKLIHEIKAMCLSDKDDYRQLEEMVFDIKTLEVQLCSSRPKTSIVREVLCALSQELAASGKHDLSAEISRMIQR
ncbi:MAG: hypothetical protein WBW79_01570 [Desulfocapsaceae bacterium]